jgi:hypothetical protein
MLQSVGPSRCNLKSEFSASQISLNLQYFPSSLEDIQVLSTYSLAKVTESAFAGPRRVAVKEASSWSKRTVVKQESTEEFMQSACRTILVSVELITVSLVAQCPMLSQSREPYDVRQSWHATFDCDESVSHSAKPRNDIGTSSRTFLRSDPGADPSGCVSPEPRDTSGRPDWRSNLETASIPPHPVVASKPEPPKPSVGEPALRDIGEAGTKISRAREAVLEILRDSNTCSEWFRQFDPQAAVTFSTLLIAVDENGAKHIIKERVDGGGWIEHGPYIARTWQGAGPGTTITLNRNGAFFRTTADLYRVEWAGGMENDTGAWRHLNIGPFDGGSLQGQVIALFHELAHVIRALPSDDSSVVGFGRSQENTNMVLRYCQSQARDLVKRQKLLSVQR